MTEWHAGDSSRDMIAFASSRFGSPTHANLRFEVADLRSWCACLDLGAASIESPSRITGIGSVLMRETGAWLASVYPELGVYLLVLEVNTSARRFYEHCRASVILTPSRH